MSPFRASASPYRRPEVNTPEAFVELESRAGRDLPHGDGTTAGQAQQDVSVAPPPSEAIRVVDFWLEAGPSLWFAKDAAFNARFREGFLHLHEAAVRGDLEHFPAKWMPVCVEKMRPNKELEPRSDLIRTEKALGGWTASAIGALALVLLLDQFPRSSFRGTPRMYATDVLARHMAAGAIEAGHDLAVPRELRLFFNLPFAHSENLADQDRSVAFARGLGEPNLSHAERHRSIIKRFGRFPHRNPILGRAMRPDEQKFLDEGGYAG